MFFLYRYRRPPISTLFPYTTLFRSQCMTTTFTCNLDAPGSELAHVWSHTVGSGRALLALRADWQAQMRKTDRKSTRLNSSHPSISYAVFCLKKKKFTFWYTTDCDHS